jgi:hypothetical protein
MTLLKVIDSSASNHSGIIGTEAEGRKENPQIMLLGNCLELLA